MSISTIAIIILGCVGLIFLTVKEIFKPKGEKPAVKAAPVGIALTLSSNFTKKQGDSTPPHEFCRNAKKEIVAVGLTLSGFCSSESFPFLEEVARMKGGPRLQFLCLDPGLDKDYPLFEVIAKNRGKGESGEDIWRELQNTKDCIEKLRGLATSPEMIETKVFDYAPGVSMLMVDPSEPRGKIRLTLPSYKTKKEERLVLAIEQGNPAPAYRTAVGVYKRLLKDSRILF